MFFGTKIHPVQCHINRDKNKGRQKMLQDSFSLNYLKSGDIKYVKK